MVTKRGIWIVAGLVIALVLPGTAQGQTARQGPARPRAQQKPAASLEWPPKLPGGAEVVTDSSPKLLVKPAQVTLASGVEIAKTPPTIDFAYYPGQDRFSKLWSVWGDGSTAGDKYYSAIGDHNSPKGRAQVYEYDPATKKLRLLVDVKQFLESSGNLPADMNYTPGKIHSRIDIGSDGWVYFSTHRGSTRTTSDAYGYQGDWVFRTNPTTGKTEIVVAHPIPKHCLPGSVLDPLRLIFYGTTQFGTDALKKGCWFYAYDVKNGKMLKTAPVGFTRYAMWAASTGCVYWTPRSENRRAGNARGDEGVAGSGKKYDPRTNQITDCPAVPDVRACTRETPDGLIYGVSGHSANLWVFNVKTEKLKRIGPGAVASQRYITTMDIDPSGRYVYYIPGAHGGGIKDGTPIVQYDVKTNTRKIIAFLNQYYTEKYSYAPDGTFGSALSADGSTLYVTWNGRRIPTAKDWDTCAMTAIHIPASERQSATQGVDMEKARELMQKQRRGESLTPQEQEILNAARAARRAGRKPGQANTAPGESQPGRKGRRAVPTEGQASTGIKPLTEMGPDEKFQGEDGGLYAMGSNEPPLAHLVAAIKQVAQIQPLDAEGRPSKDGKIVLLAIGMSNTTQEFSDFMKSANADRAKSPAVLLVDAAQGGHGAEEWTNAQSDETWARLDQRIKQAGVSHKQVQALWLKQAEHYPKPDAMENAQVLKAQLVTILQRAMARCPNLRVAYLSSRSYGGYSVKHPEPESFATAFSVRWVIQDQIAGKPELNFDPAKGQVKAPIALWGPYLWADGTMPRKSDGLVWNRADYRADGTHPTASGRAKVTAMLMKFFKTDPTAKGWYIASQQH